MIHRKKLTYATLITLARLSCVGPIVYAIHIQQWFVAFVFFVIAAATDGLDGFVARTFNECTFFGAVLDACVDKIMIVTILASLVFSTHLAFPVPEWFLLIIGIKEIVQLAGATLIYVYVHKFEIKPLLLGKITMALYVILIGILLYAHIQRIPLYIVTYWCVFVSLVAYMSFFQYFFVAYRYVNRYASKQKKVK